jgi:hypothetical protein
MVSRVKPSRVEAQVREALAKLLGVESGALAAIRDDRTGANLVIADTTLALLIEVKVGSGAAAVAAAVRQVKEQAARIRRRTIPLVVVPFMGEVGRKICEEAGIAWLDLSGNAHILAPGLRVFVEGKPNLFKAVGRPQNLFASKSSRLARWLLIHPGEYLSQRDIARATGLDEGFVSRLVARMLKEDYLVRDERAFVRAKDPSLLLDAWHETYQFSKHGLRQGHVVARSGDVLLRTVSDLLRAKQIEHAATGLAGAWALTRFAAFRIATIYLADEPSPALLDGLGFREDPRGANLWLVTPKDDGVFHGAVETDGIRCVHPVQVYLDLKAHPERSAEAAEQLRARLLDWKQHG